MKEKVEQGKKAVKTAAKAVWNWLVRYPIALIITIGLLAVAVLLMVLGVGDRFNVGGIIGHLFDRKSEDANKVKLANEIPEDRKDSKGDPIEKGSPDEHGWVQHEVKVLDRSKNPFRDKDAVVLQREDGTEKKLRLPTGVKDTDVSTVIEIEPESFEVVLKSGPEKIDQDTIDYLRG